MYMYLRMTCNTIPWLVEGKFTLSRQQQQHISHWNTGGCSVTPMSKDIHSYRMGLVRTHNSSLEGATELKSASFCSS